MDDLISRQAAIDALIRKMRPHNNGDGTITIYIMSEGLVEETLNDLPSAEPEQRWIPCSEKKPEKSGKYYVSGGGKVWICEYAIILNFACAIGGWCNDASNPVVQAWMPLLEPYNGEN